MKKEEKYIIAYDHGTSGVKTALVSIHGKVLDFIFEQTPIYLKGEGGAEQKPDEWWQALINTSQRLIEKNLVPIDDIVGICCSSQWSGTVPVDKDGNHLMNAIIWMDSRGAPYIKKQLRGFIKISGYPIRDIYKFIRIAGGAPSLTGKDPIAHILYLKHELPTIYDKTFKFLECKDYINSKLTGKIASSYDSITLHWITDNRDINQIKYDKSLIKRLGVDKEKFPVLKHSNDILGSIKTEVADEIGINRDVKVIMGSPDLQSAIIGSGAVDDFTGHLYVGTSAWIICHVPFKKTDIFHNIASIPSAIPGKYFVANEQESAGQCLNFLRDNIFYSNDKDYYGNPEVYQMFDKIVENVPVGSNNLIFTPWLYGERTPIDDHTVRGSFFNISLNTNKSHIIRAVFEGVAYNQKWVLKYVEKFVKRKMNPLNFIGGGARSDIWCQIFADVFNRTIRRVKDPIQANARGAAFIASIALGYITFNEIPKFIQFDRIFKPTEKNNEIYNRLYKEFLLFYKHNQASHRRLNLLENA